MEIAATALALETIERANREIGKLPEREELEIGFGGLDRFFRLLDAR